MPQHHPFVKTIARALRRRCGVTCGDHILVAVSGGADSVALLRALAALAPRRKWQLQLTIGHVQHHLREEAEADADFVARLIDELQLEGLRADLDPEAYVDGNIEALAREGRYAALTHMADQIGAGFVATAHHGDDQLETLLMRLLRGTSAHGLGGMKWSRGLGSDEATERGSGEEDEEMEEDDDPKSEARDPKPEAFLIRPMLNLDRAAVLEFLRDIDQPWREDHTNADVSRTRAQLRHDVLPVLHDLQPQAARRATQLAGHLREVTQVLDATVDHVVEQSVTIDDKAHIVIDRPTVADVYPVMLHELLRRVLLAIDLPADTLTRSTLQPIVSAITDGAGGKRKFSLAGGVEIKITRNKVKISAAGE